MIIIIINVINVIIIIINAIILIIIAINLIIVIMMIRCAPPAAPFSAAQSNPATTPPTSVSRTALARFLIFCPVYFVIFILPFVFLYFTFCHINIIDYTRSP